MKNGDNFWFERLFRRECTDCGKAEGLLFMTLRQLALTLPGNDGVAEIRGFLPDNSHAWCCSLCKCFGVFGPLEAG